MYKIFIILLIMLSIGCRSKKKDVSRSTSKLEVDSVGKSFKGRLTNETEKDQVLKIRRIEYEYYINPETGKPEKREKSRTDTSLESKEKSKKQADAESNETDLKKAEEKKAEELKIETKENPINIWLPLIMFVVGFAVCYRIKFLKSRSNSVQEVRISEGYQPNRNLSTDPPGGGSGVPDKN